MSIFSIKLFVSYNSSGFQIIRQKLHLKWFWGTRDWRIKGLAQAAITCVLQKKLLLKILQYSQENTCVGVSL